MARGAAMNSGGSVTHWINEIKEGNREAAQGLWERYFARLVHLARNQLPAQHRRAFDEEDVALSAFHTFCAAAEKGRFPDLSDRDSLWRLLVRMTARKAIDQQRFQRRQKRWGGGVCSESAWGRLECGDDPQMLADVIGNMPSPEFVAMIREQFQRLLDLLQDDDLQALAIAKMVGYSNREIADRLACASRTVERRLRLIRAKCKEEFLDD